MTSLHRARSLLATVTAPLLLALPMLVHCGGQATCDDVCDNVLDKCGGATDEVARNACLEQCAQRVEAVPTKCAADRDGLLTCVADAESVDCLDPARSAACSAESEALDACALDGGSGGGGSGAGGEPCTDDDECPTGICNAKLQRCAAPGAIGDPCYDDDECESDLCNSPLEQCAVPGELGSRCYDDDECVSELCNSPLEQCAVPGGLGSRCYDDDECESGLCNSPLEQCAVPGGAGTPCYDDDECQSLACGADETCA